MFATDEKRYFALANLAFTLYIQNKKEEADRNAALAKDCKTAQKAEIEAILHHDMGPLLRQIPGL